MRRLFSISALAFGFALAVGQASAQGQAPSVREACASSARKLCSAQAMSGDRAGVRACMLKNVDKLSEQCRVALKAAQAERPGESPAAEPAQKP